MYNICIAAVKWRCYYFLAYIYPKAWCYNQTNTDHNCPVYLYVLSFITRTGWEKIWQPLSNDIAGIILDHNPGKYQSDLILISQDPKREQLLKVEGTGSNTSVENQGNKWTCRKVDRSIFQSRLNIWDTLPETNTAPENRPSQKKTSIPTDSQSYIFRCYVIFRDGNKYSIPGVQSLPILPANLHVQLNGESHGWCDMAFWSSNLAIIAI